MSDLISRSSAIKEMEKLKQEVNMPVDIVWNNLLKACIDTVNEQPTAYDVDKVVKELESIAESNEYVSERLKGIESKRQRKLWLERASAFRKAIEIVKGGGVNERD